MQEQLASVVEEAKANDPKELRKCIAELEAAAKKAPAPAPIDKPAEKKAAADRDRKAHIRGKVEGYGEAMKDIAAIFRDLTNATAKLKPAVDAIEANAKNIEGWATRTKEKQAELAKQAPDALAIAPAPTFAAPRAPAAILAARKPSPAANGDGALSNSERKIIDAIRWWNVLGVPAPSHAQVAFIAGYSHKSGTWSTYLSRLRSTGMIEGRGDLVLTAEGAALAAEPDTPPTRGALHAAVLEKIDAPLQKILGPLLNAYPDGLTP
jgi:uncharacterized protein